MIVIDNFIEVHDIKVVQGTDRLFVGMPSRKTADGGFADMVHPIFAGAREVIEVPVLDAYAAYVAQMT